MSQLKVGLESLENLLKRDNLCIPDYQRPYSWTDKQLAPIIHDLYNREGGELIIMGGVILHEGKDSRLNIVDGQQRLVSFSILSNLLDENADSKLLSHKFDHNTSIENIQNNVRYFEEVQKKKGDKKLSLKNIHFITVTTPSLEDAFNFFDSQNTRGKKLENYDILKAHHLRFIKSDTLATACAKDWEIIEKDKSVGLGLLLETLLARGRKWSNKQHIIPDIRKEFKSQRSNKKSASTYLLNRYQQAALFTSWKYNPIEKACLEFTFDKIDATYKVGSVEVNDNIYKYFPFQITQTIEGGELFFWYTQKYHALAKELFSDSNEFTSPEFKALLKRLHGFNYNIGAAYTLDVFRGSLLFYIDKFGYQDLDAIASELFYSIYWLRFKQTTVQYNSVYKYIREDFNPFSLIRNASFPSYIIDRCRYYLEGKYTSFEVSKGIRKDFYKSVFLNQRNNQKIPQLSLVTQNSKYNSFTSK